jgi:N-acyl-D-amino-acid deacylase
MHDIVIRGGTVFDGLGSEGVVGDVAVRDGRVVETGRVGGGAARVVDATGLYVVPGFVDGHTHLDAQIFWDPYAGSLLSHGVTTAVMGNCGFTLAPGTDDQADLVIRSIERAEDMSRAAITRGVPWTWSTFADYLDAVDGLPKALNVGAQVGHCALRAAVMGERAFSDPAGEDDLAHMSRAVEAAVAAGALGFSTSRSRAHVIRDGSPVASRLAGWEEVVALVMAMARRGGGMFQLAPERSTEPAELADFQARLSELAAASGCPVTFMVGGQPEQLATVDGVVAAGGVATGQVHVRGFESIFGFRTTLPFDRLPGWGELRAQPHEVQLRMLGDEELRARLVAEAESGDYGEAVGAEVRAPDFDQITIVDGAEQERSVAAAAAAWQTSPVELMIHLAVSSDLDQLFRQPLGHMPSDLVLQALRHPNTVVAASDSGAHISQILDSNIPTYFLSHWVRARQDFGWAEAIHMLTGRPARVWGLAGRGTLREGSHADVVVLDPGTVGCDLATVVNDLPDRGPRLAQAATGIHAVVVNGALTMQDGQATGALGGRLLRGRAAAPASASGAAAG